jgi:hypothetical protein
MHVRASALLAVVIVAGCETQPIPDCESNCNDIESNDTFAAAQMAEIAADGSARIVGIIDDIEDIDVFQLGSARAGDDVRIALTRIDAGLRAALALYDAEGELIDDDTLTSLVSASSDPVIQHRVRADSTRMYVAVAHVVGRPTSGAYELDIDFTRGGSPPDPLRQAVLLGFAGGTVEDPLFGTLTAGPFDAGDIDPAYAGATEIMKAIIREAFAQNYARFDIELWDTDDPQAAAALAGRTHATVVFGGFNAIAFGAAQSVDRYNQDHGDAAIIFTESFQPELFIVAPTAEELAVAIGNVAAHEMGHLLGLQHVIDATEIMDEASPPPTLLARQEFKSAPLSPSIFPLGRHDSADLLSVTLGRRVGAPKLAYEPLTPLSEVLTELLRAGESLDFGPAPAAPAKCLNCLWRSERQRRE